MGNKCKWVARLRDSAVYGVTRMTNWKTLFIANVSLWVLSNPVLSQATETLGQIGQYQQNTAEGLYAGAEYFVDFLGFISVVSGIFLWVSAHKKHDSPMVGIVTLIAGIFLVSVDALIQSGSATVFGGTNSSELTQLGGS